MSTFSEKNVPIKTKKVVNDDGEEQEIEDFENHDNEEHEHNEDEDNHEDKTDDLENFKSGRDSLRNEEKEISEKNKQIKKASNKGSAKGSMEHIKA